MKKKLKYPLKSKKGGFVSYPDNAECTCCDTKLDKGDFICLNTGSMSGTEFFMNLRTHFDTKDIYGGLDVVSINGPQIDIYFCSTECLRDFFNNVCDKLEEKTFPDKHRINKINKIL